MDENTALDEIKFIKKIIEDSKRTVINDGIGYIFWGLIVTIGLLADYLIFVLQVNLSFIWVWVVLIGFGWIYSFISYFRKGKKHRSHNFASMLLRSIWLACGIAMTIVGFVGVFSGAIGGVFVSPLISSILGIGFMMSGYIYNLNWVKYLSAGWWVGAIVMFIYPGIQTILIMAFMMLAFQVVPGIIIYNKFKKEIALSK